MGEGRGQRKLRPILKTRDLAVILPARWVAPRWISTPHKSRSREALRVEVAGVVRWGEGLEAALVTDGGEEMKDAGTATAGEVSFASASPSPETRSRTRRRGVFEGEGSKQNRLGRQEIGDRRGRRDWEPQLGTNYLSCSFPYFFCFVCEEGTRAMEGKEDALADGTHGLLHGIGMTPHVILCFRTVFFFLHKQRHFIDHITSIKAPSLPACCPRLPRSVNMVRWMR